MELTPKRVTPDTIRMQSNLALTKQRHNLNYYKTQFSDQCQMKTNLIQRFLSPTKGTKKTSHLPLFLQWNKLIQWPLVWITITRLSHLYKPMKTQHKARYQKQFLVN